MPGLDVLDVADPEPVGLCAREVSVDEVWCRRAPGLADRGAWPAASSVCAFEAELAHQPGDTLLADTDAVSESELGLDSRGPVDAFRLLMHTPDPNREVDVGELAIARPSPLPRVVALTSHTHDAAQQGDRKLCSLRLDKPKTRHGLSVSLAKKAAARFKISRSWRSTLFSRSSSRNFARSCELSMSSRSPRSA